MCKQQHAEKQKLKRAQVRAAAESGDAASMAKLKAEAERKAAARKAEAEQKAAAQKAEAERKAAAQKTGEPRTCRQHAHVRRTRLSLFGHLSFTLALLPSLSVIDSV